MRALPRARRAFFGALVMAGVVGGTTAVGACDTFDTAPASDGGAGAADTGTPVVDSGGPDGEGPTRDGGEGGVPFKPCSSGTRVFVTSGLFNADFARSGGPRAAANAICNAHALNAGLAGNFVAWLGTESENASTSTTGPFVSVDCSTKFADSRGSLTLALSHAFDRDEQGRDVDFDGGTTHTVWTGAVGDGTRTGAHCANWSAQSASPATSGDLKGVAAGSWTTGGNAYCNNLGRLYCFELPTP